MRSPSTPSSQRSRGVPVEFNHAITYVNKIKMRFAAEPDRYKEFLEILQTYQKESRPIHEVYAQVQLLFSSAPDLLDEFKQFLPDTSEPGTGGGALAGMGIGSPLTAYARAGAGAAAAGSGMAQGQYAHTGGAPAHGMGAAEAMATGRLPPVGNFAPTGGHAVDPFSGAPSGAPGAGASYDSKMPATTPGASRKRRGVMTGGPQAVGSTSAKRRTKGPKGDGAAGDGPPGYGTPGPQPGGPQQLANPASATSEELAFFERAKRFIGQPSAYNEFLKLLNLFNQQVLDPKTLVERAESFIGDDHELFGWFKQFVGFDDQQRELDDARSGDEEIVESLLGPEPAPYMPPEEAAKTLRPARPKVDLMQCKAYGPSYRLLPDAATRAKCSGRDAMCYEVLNDRWASHPTWASEDTEFVHHKKNQFEEAMFRSEEDRHEMDIEIDTNLSVIRQLTPLAQQIEQMDPEKQMQLTLPENFLSMSEALPRRVLRRVYDSGRALEIIKAMHTHPAVAIPIVLKRLKQKDEEWRRQRREFSKIWRETDERNYYRALDHQGLTFKATDRKLTSPKHLFAEIEARRREQQNLLAYESTGAQRQSRKVASALRHRYQLEYQFSEPTVLADVINAILAHVGRQNSQFAPSEKEMMERFFHDLFGGLFGVERGEQSHVSAPSDRDESNSDDGDDGEAKPAEKPAAATNGHAANGAAAVSGAPAAQDAEAEAAATPASNAMDVDDKAETAVPGESGASAPEANGADAAPADGKDNGAATKAAAASPRAEDDSKPSTPGLISSRSWIQLGSAARDQSVAASAAGTATKSLSRAFYANSNYYMFLRLFQILYERFNRLRELGP
ncbi:Transcriptional regulatory protein sin3, partial [Coemansia helicoidea]